MTAVLTLAFAVGVQDGPQAASQVDPWSAGVILVGSPSFYDGITAVSTIVCAFFFPFPSLLFLQDSLEPSPSLVRRRSQLCQHFGRDASSGELWEEPCADSIVRHRYLPCTLSSTSRPVLSSILTAFLPPEHRLRRSPLLRRLRFVARSRIRRPASE